MITHHNKNWEENEFKSHRLVFFADTPNTKNTTKDPDEEKKANEKKEHAVINDKSIDEACKGSTIPDNMLSDSKGTLREWLKRSAKRGGNYAKLCRDFVIDGKRRGTERKFLHAQFFKEINLFEGNTKPWADLTKKRLAKPAYKSTIGRAIELHEMKGRDAIVGKHLVQALVDGHITIEQFNAWSKDLLGREDREPRKKVLREKLGVLEYKGTANTGRAIQVAMSVLDVQSTEVEINEVTGMRGLKGVHSEVRKVITHRERPGLSEYQLARRAEYQKTAKEFQVSARKRNEAEDSLIGFMTTDMQFRVEGAPKQTNKFLAKNKEFLRDRSTKPSNEAERREAFSAVLINRIAAASMKAGAETLDKVFTSEYATFVRTAAEVGVKAEIPQAARARMMKDLKELVEAEKECQEHLKTKREIEIEDRTDKQRKTQATMQMLTDRGMAGIKLPCLMDESGRYKNNVECDQPLLITDNGKTLKVKLTMFSNAQTEEGRKDREELKDWKAENTEDYVYRIEGVDENGQRFHRDMNKGDLFEYTKTHNLRHDFSVPENETAIEDAQKILDEQGINVTLAKYSKFVSRFNEVQKGGMRLTKYKTFTINNINDDGSIVLDQDITLFNSFKSTTPKEQQQPQIRPAGKPIELGEFVSWCLRQNKIYDHIEETPETQTEEHSAINRRLEEIHEEQRKEAAESGAIMPDRAAKVGDVLFSRADGSVYAVQRDPDNYSSVKVVPMALGKPGLKALPNEGAEAVAESVEKNLTHIEPVSMDGGEFADFYRRGKFEVFDPPTHAARQSAGYSKVVPPAIAQQAYDNAKAEAERTLSRAKKEAQEAMEEIRVSKGAAPMYGTAAARSTEDADIQAAPTAPMEDELTAPPASGPAAAGMPGQEEEQGPQEPELSPHEQEVEDIVRRAEETEGQRKYEITPGALPLLHDKDVKVEYAADSFLRTMWRNTTVLSNNDIFEMGKAMYEYYNRRWERNVKNRYSSVGKNVPWFGTEMDRINQQAETEEVNQFKEAMGDWGIWQIEDELFNTGNRDKAKACFITLSEKGQLRWDDVRIWETLNKLTDSKYHIHIPVNGDPQVKDPKTGKTGIEMLPAAVDSLWGEGQYNDWYTSNASTYDSDLKKYNEEGKQLEADPYNNGTVSGKMKQLLTRHKQGEYVDPHEYEGLIHFMIDAGKADVESKLYYLIQGLACKNDRGQTLLSLDRAGSIDGVFLNRLPWLDYIVKRNVKRGDGRITGWQIADFEEWAKKFDEGSPGGRYENTAYKNNEIWNFIWENMLNDDKTIIRTNKGLRNAEQMDHDDAHFLIPLATEQVVENVLTGPTGSKKYFTFEGYANAVPGYAQLLRGRGKMNPPQAGLIFNTIKSFVRFDSIMSNRLYRKEGNRYARLDKSYLSRGSVVSGVPTGKHQMEIRNFIKDVASAYGYDTSLIFKELPFGKEYEKQQEQIEQEILNFGNTLEERIKADPKGSQKMMDILGHYIATKQLTGLESGDFPQQSLKDEDATGADFNEDELTTQF